MNNMKGKKIIELESEIAKGNITALEEFWSEVQTNGSPLIEKIDGDNINDYVTILYKEGESKVDNIVIHGTGIGFDYMENRMERLLNTNVWYKTYILPNDTEFVYWLSVNDALDDDTVKRQKNFIIDPLNPKVFTMKDDADEPAGYDFSISHVQMPAIKPKKWIVSSEDTFKGSLDKHIFKSEIMNNERRVWVYTPYDYSRENKEYDFLVLLDGNSYVKWLSATTVLDNLISKGIIPPIVAVFVSSISKTRMSEMSFNDSFLDFITEEVLPYVRKNYNVSSEPSKNIIGGISLGGLTATYMGLRHSEVFGNVISQSGSHFWKHEGDEQPEWLIRQFESADKLPLKMFFTYGIFETSPKAGPTLIQSNRKLIEVLIQKGYDIYDTEFKSGHDYLNWGETLAEGLISLIGNK